uniref:Phosphoglycerate mutase-like protein n=1 Tax=Globisporangium ultimum (strain ATCC 200006 / CBS 805.95 / DAOM BR144) TaxID=431595 RepID=K3W7W0_GLOUD
MATVRLIPGFFAQGEALQQEQPVTGSPPNMGLLSGKTWGDVNALIRESEKHGPQVKLVILMRHGEGLHNADKARAGDQVWENELQFLPKYIDAPLTEAGVAQSKDAAKVLEEQISCGGLQVQRVIVSPLDRTLATYEHTFASFQKIPVTSMEITRETLGVCPCDQRKPMASKVATYLHIDFSSVQDEDDVWWKADHRETDEEITARGLQFLHEVYFNQPETHFAVVTHSGFSRGCFRALGHRYYRPQNAEFIPLLITSATSNNAADESASIGASPLE